MNGQIAKKLRKLVREKDKAAWIEYVKLLKQWPLRARWQFCWWLLFGKVKDIRL